MQIKSGAACWATQMRTGEQRATKCRGVTHFINCVDFSCCPLEKSVDLIKLPCTLRGGSCRKPPIKIKPCEYSVPYLMRVGVMGTLRGPCVFYDSHFISIQSKDRRSSITAAWKRWHVIFTTALHGDHGSSCLEAFQRRGPFSVEAFLSRSPRTFASHSRVSLPTAGAAHAGCRNARRSTGSGTSCHEA